MKSGGKGKKGKMRLPAGMNNLLGGNGMGGGLPF